MPKWIVLMMALLLPPLQVGHAQGAVNAAASVTITTPELRQAAPGEYVTLNFMVSGQGEYDMTADGGPDWVPVTRTRKVRLSGHTLVPVTFRVPNLALVGPSPVLSLQLSAGGQPVASAQTRVEVLPRAKVAIRAPAELTGLSDQRLNYQVEVTNLGNQADTLELSVTNVDERPRLSERTVYLQPGERKVVGVSLDVGRVSPGYQYIAFLEATSKNNPEARDRTRTLVVFNPAYVAGTQKVDGPQLTFGLRAGVEGAMNWSPEGRSTTLRYGVQPRVDGDLSDYATGKADLGGLEGSSQHWIPQGVSFGVHVQSVKWDLDAAISRRGVAANATLRRGQWRYSPRLSFQTVGADGRRFSGGLKIEGPLLGGQIEANAGTTLTSNRASGQAASVRSDLLNVRYTHTFSPRLALSLGTLANGVSVDGTYSSSAVAYEQVTYNTPTFDLTQTYSGTLSGYHTLGLSGGLRATQPFGVRGAVLAQYTPRGFTYSGTGQVTYTATNGFGLSLGGRFTVGATGDQVTPWNVVAGIRSPRWVWRGASLGGAASYTFTPSLKSPGQYLQQINSSLNLQVGALGNSAVASWSREPQSAGPASEKMQLNLTSTYRWASGDSLSASYDFERLREEEQRTTHGFRASWSRQWTPRLSSQLDYYRSWQLTSQGQRTLEGVGMSAGMQDVLIRGLSVRAGYYVSAPNGLMNGSLSNSVRLALSYDAAWAFNTPQPIVKLMGGRKGGQLNGVLYRDDNFNNQRDAGEPGLAGVTVEAGKERTVSGADGHYSMRVPTGTYELKFPAGLPATLEALAENSVDIKENSTSERLIAFAPVARSEVLVFNDLNRNGTRDEHEAALPYAGVIFSGPVTREVQADSRGYARVATLPAGQYTVRLNPQQLPEGFTTTTDSTALDLQGGQTAPLTELGAALPPKQTVATFTAGNIALLARVTTNQLEAGQTTQLTAQVQNAQSISISAFGQTWTPPLTGSRLELPINVPAATAPGEYTITLVARNAAGERTSTVKLLVTARP